MRVFFWAALAVSLPAGAAFAQQPNTLKRHGHATANDGGVLTSINASGAGNFGGQLRTASTMTVVGNAFSVGVATFTISAGIVTSNVPTIANSSFTANGLLTAAGGLTIGAPAISTAAIAVGTTFNTWGVCGATATITVPAVTSGVPWVEIWMHGQCHDSSSYFILGALQDGQYISGEKAASDKTGFVGGQVANTTASCSFSHKFPTTAGVHSYCLTGFSYGGTLRLEFGAYAGYPQAAPQFGARALR